MPASGTPLGERRRGWSWRKTVTAYVVASSVGGAVIGAVFGALGMVLHVQDTLWILVAAGVLALVAAMLALAGLLPTVRLLLDETWVLLYRDWIYGAGFGLQLG